jgi:hypothetical protein
MQQTLVLLHLLPPLERPALPVKMPRLNRWHRVLHQKRSRQMHSLLSILADHPHLSPTLGAVNWEHP